MSPTSKRDGPGQRLRVDRERHALGARDVERAESRIAPAAVEAAAEIEPSRELARLLRQRDLHPPVALGRAGREGGLGDVEVRGAIACRGKARLGERLARNIEQWRGRQRAEIGEIVYAQVGVVLEFHDVKACSAVAHRDAGRARAEIDHALHHLRSDGQDVDHGHVVARLVADVHAPRVEDAERHARRLSADRHAVDERGRSGRRGVEHAERIARQIDDREIQAVRGERECDRVAADVRPADDSRRPLQVYHHDRVLATERHVGVASAGMNRSRARVLADGECGSDAATGDVEDHHVAAGAVGDEGAVAAERDDARRPIADRDLRNLRPGVDVEQSHGVLVLVDDQRGRSRERDRHEARADLERAQLAPSREVQHAHVRAIRAVRVLHREQIDHDSLRAGRVDGEGVRRVADGDGANRRCALGGGGEARRRHESRYRSQHPHERSPVVDIRAGAILHGALRSTRGARLEWHNPPRPDLPGRRDLTSSAVKTRPAVTLGGAAANAFALAACVAGAAGLSLALGQDASWDLQNYHYYNPWAFVHGQRGYTPTWSRRSCRPITIRCRTCRSTTWWRSAGTRARSP